MVIFGIRGSGGCSMGLRSLSQGSVSIPISVELLTQDFGERRTLLFGSLGRGDAGPGSDLDLLNGLPPLCTAVCCRKREANAEGPNPAESDPGRLPIAKRQQPG